MANPNITLLGATYSDVSGVSLPKQGGGTATFPFVEGSQTITQNGTVDVTNLAEVVVDVSGGGGGTTTAERKDVNFIDYDGTIVYSYTAEEAQALTELPSNPSHTGLVAQGWNWTLAQIKAQLTATPDAPVWVGQMYITQSGDTEIDVHFPNTARLSPILTVAINGTITVDWGDGTTADTVTGTAISTRKDVPHTYAKSGKYTIKIHAVSGSYSFYNSSSYTLLRKNTTTNENRVYANCIKAIRLGSGIDRIATYAFSYCHSLTSITIPKTVTVVDTFSFYYCFSLASITIPNTVATIGGNAFQYCYALDTVSIPNSVTNIATYAFGSCYSLSSLTMPNSVTTIGTYVAVYCYSLSSLAISNSVTSLTSNAFASCASLASVTIPSSVTSIATSVFSSCYGVKEYHVKPTTPPTLSSNVFSSISSDCIIYVPSSSVNTYKSATRWSDQASKIQAEP